MQTTQFPLFSSDNEKVFVEVYFKDENIWLTQKLMGKLFNVQTLAINRHLKNIFESGELEESKVVSIFGNTLQTRTP